MLDFFKRPRIRINFTGGASAAVELPSKNIYNRIATGNYSLKQAVNIADEILKTADGDVPADLTDADKLEVLTRYTVEVLKLADDYAAKIPFCPDDNGEKCRYSAETAMEKLVADYTRLSFFEIDELNIYDFFALARDAVICNNNGTKSGREYLEQCWMYQQTEPDREGLHELRRCMERGRSDG